MSIYKIKGKKFKVIWFIIAISMLHIVVILASIKGYNIYESQAEERRIRDHMKSGVIDENAFAGTIFEYDLEYNLKNGETRNFSGKEIYYWNGKKLVPVSEFMKGYNQ